MATLLKTKNLRTKMIQKMKLSTTMVSLTNGKDMEILLKLDQLMIGIMILVLTTNKKQGVMLLLTEHTMVGLTCLVSGVKTTSWMAHTLLFQEMIYLI
jgi:hypothetical protein